MKKMSKLFAVLLAMLMLCGMLAGCGKQQTEQESQSGQTEQNALEKVQSAGKLAVQSGTTADKFCQNNQYQVSAFTANNDAQAALLAGKVDAWVIDDLTAAEMVKAYNAEHPDALVVLSEAMTTEPYAFAFAKGSDALVSKINEALHELLNDGTVKALFEKYEAPYTAPSAE